MDYYYDILLNFQDNYTMFYEWDSEDEINYIKKIPLMHVDAKTLINFISKKIIVDEEFLKLIENKTKLKGNNTLKYTCIFSDGKNSIALEFQDNGEVLSKSSLILEDELNINEFMYNIMLKKINYKIIKDDEINNETRQDLKIKRILKLEINSIYERKEYSKLKYLYLEWFQELLPSIDEMYHNMLNKLNNKLTEKEYSIYELIKMSYNNV